MLFIITIFEKNWSFIILQRNFTAFLTELLNLQMVHVFYEDFNIYLLVVS